MKGLILLAALAACGGGIDKKHVTCAGIVSSGIVAVGEEDENGFTCEIYSSTSVMTGIQSGQLCDVQVGGTHWIFEAPSNGSERVLQKVAGGGTFTLECTL